MTERDRRGGLPGRSMTVFSSIRTRLAVYFSLVGIAVLTAAVLVHALGLPFLGYHGMRGSRRMLALQHLADIADLGKAEVLRWLDELSSDIVVLADHRRVVEDAQVLCKARRRDRQAMTRQRRRGGAGRRAVSSLSSWSRRDCSTGSTGWPWWT